jgi:hypothetical protein
MPSDVAVVTWEEVELGALIDALTTFVDLTRTSVA